MNSNRPPAHSIHEEAGIRAPVVHGTALAFTFVADEGSNIVAALEAEALRLGPGAKLPSESALIQRFGVTRHVVRKALAQLEAQYIVRRVKGSGTFVNARRDYILSPHVAPSLHETFSRVGCVTRTFVVDVALLPPPHDAVARMGLAPGRDLVRLTGAGYVDDELATYGHVWLAPRVASAVDASLRAQLRAYESMTELLRASGADPIRRWTGVEPSLAPAEMLERLPGVNSLPVWWVSTLTTDGPQGDPLMFSHGWMRQDRVTISIDYEYQRGT